MPADTDKNRALRSLLAAGLVVLLGACATTAPGEGAENGREAPPAEERSRDPLEGFNRAMYRFNETFDDYLMKPVARGYRWLLPSPVRTGIANFFRNLREPIVIVNDLLQGKLGQAASDTGRFLTNTTLGLAGLFDPASSLGMPRHDEDFGQTFGKWGVGEGPYIVWPILGPSTLRDSAGMVGDWYAYPPTHMDNEGRRNTLRVLEAIDLRAQLLDATDILEQAAGEDPYVFVREAYRNRRQYLIYDGNPPREDPKGLFDDDPPPPPARQGE
jgi:phospholipid-binding lipoprotein MlaA